MPATPSRNMLLFSLSLRSSFFLCGSKKVEGPLLLPLWPADACVSGMAKYDFKLISVIPVDLLWLPDAPQPVHLLPKLWPQAEQFFYLGTIPTGMLISAIRHWNKAQAHSAAWDMDGCVLLFLLTHKASHFITKGNQDMTYLSLISIDCSWLAASSYV